MYIKDALIDDIFLFCYYNIIKQLPFWNMEFGVT